MVSSFGLYVAQSSLMVVEYEFRNRSANARLYN